MRALPRLKIPPKPICYRLKFALTLLHILVKPAYSSPLIPHFPASLENRTFPFRVTAYNKIMNHIVRESDAATGSSIQQMSYSDKGKKAAVIVGLTIALALTVAIASLVTAATLSILAFNKIYLRVIADSGTKEEQEYAKQVLKLRRRPYSIICAFVFTGSAMAELIPLLISLIIQEASHGTVSGNLDAISIVIAVGLVIIFVELLPLGYTVRKALFVNRFLIEFAQLINVIWYPLTLPISYIFGALYSFQLKNQKPDTKSSRFANTEERFFRNEELTRFVELHIKLSAIDSDHEGGNVNNRVVDILKGGFKLQDMRPRDLMIGWKTMRYESVVFNLETKVTRDSGLALYESGIDGALVVEIEDVSDPELEKDIEMVPLNGKKVKGFVHWSSFISRIDETEVRVKFLAREVMPIIYDCFDDLLDLFSILHYGRCKMALVVINPPAHNEKGRANIPPCEDYVVSTDRVYWSNQPQIFAYVKPIGVITYQALLKVILAGVTRSTQMMPDPMERFKPTRLNTQEKLALIDSMTPPGGSRESVSDRGRGKSEGSSTGLFERVLNFGTRRRKGTRVDKSTVGSSRGSLFEALEGPLGGRENGKMLDG
ncbi:hypothetical protein H072_9573 [Dactylellina haptotyla CBS 200.50]|uniref:CNNM transmembrane domain-containing protein n=1 Tax=Dactylellina haptotyla (strain CBS 200.50) TaxID=1284197 RepID=S8A6K7_DACHA|nr:hypothetical protein H072_9573 [Dactylellina haptotyla CBS 200.50]